MSKDKAWIAVNHGGSFVKDGQRTKYVHGSTMMLEATLQSGCFAEFMEDMHAGLHCDDFSRVYYKDPTQLESYLLLYDDSSFANFIYHFLNNSVVEVFVEQDSSAEVGMGAVGEGGDIPLLPWQQVKGNPEAEANVDMDDLDETVSEWSETATSDSNEITAAGGPKSSEGGGAESGVGNKDVIVDRGVGLDRTEGQDDTDYANSEDDLLEEDVPTDEESDRGDEGQDTHSKRTSHEFPRFDPSAKVPVFAIGMVFDDAKQFKEAVDRHSIYEQRGLWYQRNSYYYFRVKCVDARCPWNLTASLNRGIGELQVKVYKPQHICQPIYKNKRANSKWLAEEFRDTITSTPSMGQAELKDLVKKRLGLNIALSKARRTRDRVLRQLQCDYVKEYERLWDYAQELKKSNTTVVLEVSENMGQEKSDFKRIYICFEACRLGFLAGCRRIIGIDGCFLTGLCKGQILTAVGRDANNGMFPIAWAVVEVENEINWKWFLGLLCSELGIRDKGEGWTFVSDRQKGLMNAVEYIFPKCEHRYCARHLTANWRAKHAARRLNTIFWACAKSSNMADFRQNMETLHAHSPAAYADVREVEFRHWVKAYFRTDLKCDAVENNLCEAFNAEILNYRSKAIITMLEAIRTYVMNRMEKHRNKASEWARDCSPRALQKLDEARCSSRFCCVKFAGDHGFEIEHHDDVYVVDVTGRKCTCGLWQVRGIPCSHGVSAIHYLNKDVEDYVDACYRKAAYISAYQHSIPLLPGMRFWEDSGRVGPLPPIPRPKRGRPQKKRRKEAAEKMGSRLSQKGQVQICSRCGRSGHNTRKCKGIGCLAPARKVRKIDSQQLPNPSVASKPKRRKGPCGYGVYFDEQSQQTIFNPGRRGERVLATTGGASSSSNVGSEVGSRSTLAISVGFHALTGEGSDSARLSSVAGAPSKPDPHIITQEVSIQTTPSSTPKSRPKLPVRRGLTQESGQSPIAPTRRSERIMNLNFASPRKHSNSTEHPTIIDLED